ncbi:MAG: hypothetical protein HWN51_05250 [Desulfobacterales bacterium]|nr:hypothetical protein [Desulfobacterales bacterium]
MGVTMACLPPPLTPLPPGEGRQQLESDTLQLAAGWFIEVLRDQDDSAAGTESSRPKAPLVNAESSNGARI